MPDKQRATTETTLKQALVSIGENLEGFTSYRPGVAGWFY